MKDIPAIISALRDAPAVLENLIAGVPAGRLKQRRRPGKWSIHENACHLVQVQPMLTARFRLFAATQNPIIEPFLPGQTAPDDNLADLDLESELERFPALRSEMLAVVAEFTPAIWARRATHPEYTEYTPYILLRHILMHDYFHMYRIEELWLTTDAFLMPK